MGALAEGLKINSPKSKDVLSYLSLEVLKDSDESVL